MAPHGIADFRRRSDIVRDGAGGGVYIVWHFGRKKNAENVGFVLTFSFYNKGYSNNYGMCIFIHHLHHLNFGDLDYSVLIDKEKGEEMFF